MPVALLSRCPARKIRPMPDIMADGRELRANATIQIREDRFMRDIVRWSTGWIALLLVGVPLVAAQQHGHQQMMKPRVPADKLDEARALQNPLPSSPDIVEQGKAIYEGKGTCVNCHGAGGRGNGPAGAVLNPPPRSFHSHGFWRHRSEGEIFWVIKHGSPGTGMIPFGGLLTDEEIWTVIHYERSFAGGPRGEGGRGHGRGGRGGRGGRHGGSGMMQHGGDHDLESGSEGHEDGEAGYRESQENHTHD